MKQLACRKRHIFNDEDSIILSNGRKPEGRLAIVHVH
jgi:hypothetical protein